MTDTTAPTTPKWQLILGLLPSLNQSLIILVTAAASILGTLATQHYTATPVAPEVKTVTVERIIERPTPVDLSDLDKRITAAVAEALSKNAGPGRKKKSPEPLK